MGFQSWGKPLVELGFQGVLGLGAAGLQAAAVFPATALPPISLGGIEGGFEA